MRGGAAFSLLGGVSLFLLSLACSSDGTGEAAVIAEKAFVVVLPPPGEDLTASAVVSHDGRTVAGFSGRAPANALEIYRWTAAGGPRGEVLWLKPPGVDRDPTALINVFSVGISEDASTLVGTMARGGAPALYHWTAEHGMTDLGTIPGRGLALLRFAISGVGDAVMATAGRQSFRWTRAEGRVDLSQLPGDLGNEAIAMSTDGRVIIGNSTVVPESVSRVFRWSVDRGITGIDPPPGSRSCETSGQLSADGAVLFATCKPVVSGQAQMVLRWTEAEGPETISVTDLPYALVTPFGASADGSALIGSFAQGSPPLPTEPPTALASVFRWTEQAGVERLEPPAGWRDCLSINTATQDLFTVVATCGAPGVAGALVKWGSEGAVVLEPPAGLVEARATSITADGHVVAGSSRSNLPGSDTDSDTVAETAVIWDDRRAGPLLVVDVLRDQQIATPAEVEGLQLRSARISRDGHTLIGDAVDPSSRRVSWVARLP